MDGSLIVAGTSRGLMVPIVSLCYFDSFSLHFFLHSCPSPCLISFRFFEFLELIGFVYLAAMGDFWRARNEWQSTWSNDPEERSLIV